MTLFNQSESFISEYRSNFIQKFVYDIGSRKSFVSSGTLIFAVSETQDLALSLVRPLTHPVRKPTFYPLQPPKQDR